jgi:hypothetical protein
MATTPTSSVLNFVIRMVVPMRREFGRSLDVQQFMRDQAYAQAVLEQALTSQDQRLRDHAEYVSRHLLGARDSAPPTPPVAASLAAQSATAAGTPAAPAVAGEPTEAELRARMLRKYTTGLR